MDTIWVYKPPRLDYFIAKSAPFGFFAPGYDNRSGDVSYRMIQGVCISKPATWDWTQKVDNRIFAGFHNEIYDITDLVRPPLRSGPP